jgi:PAS domain S-box-containing protein
MSPRRSQSSKAPPDAPSSDEQTAERALETLRASQAGLAEAQRIAHLGSWDWNIAEGSLFWSDEIYRIFGIEPREFGATYEAFLAFIHPDDREGVEKAVSLALRGEKPYSLRHRIVRPGGEERVVHERGEVSFDGSGKPARMLGTVQDVTVQARLEEELARSQAYNRGLIEASADGLITIDAEGTITDVNEQMCRMTGHSREELIGSAFASYFAEPESAEAGVRETFAKGVVIDYALTLLTAQGDEVVVSFNAAVYRDQQGEVAGIFASARDISERKRFEEERQVARFFDGALDLAGIANLEGYFVRVNPAFEQTLGWTTEEICSMPFIDFVHPDDREPTLDEFRRSEQGAAALNFENRYRCKDGSYRWLRWKTAPATEAGLLYAIARDVTEEKRAEEKRERELSRIEALQQLGAGLSGAATPAQVLEVISSKLFRALGAGSGSLGLANEDRSALEIVFTGADVLADRYSLTPLDADLPGPICVRENEALWFESPEDLESGRFGGKVLADAGHQALACLPLATEEGAIGYLGARFGEPHRFDDEERAFALSAAELCSQALVRARLLEQREQALLRTEALQGVSAALTAAVTPEEVLQVVFDEALSALGADSGALGLLGDDGETIATRRTGVPAAISELYALESIHDRGMPQASCVRSGAEFWCSTIDELRPDCEPAAEILSELGIKSFVCLPLLSEGEKIGYLAARFREPRTFSEADRAFARTVAEQCSQALARSRLYEQREDALVRTRILQSVSAGLARATTIEDVGRIIYEEALPLLGVRAGAIGMLDEERKRLRTAMGGWGSEVVERYSDIPLEADLPAAACVRENQPRWYRTPTEVETAFANVRDLINENELEAAFVVPLVARGEPIGFLTGFFVEPRAFGERDRELIETVAEQCAQAVTRARLHEGREEALARTEGLEQISAGLARAATSEEVAEVIFESVFTTLGASASALGIVNRDRSRIDILTTGFPEQVVDRYRYLEVDADMPGAACIREVSARWYESAQELLSDYPGMTDVIGDSLESFFFVPLEVRGEALGHLAGYFPESRSFDDRDRAYIGTIAEQCALALARARLYEERSERAEASLVLDRVGEGIFRLDGEERITTWNQAAAGITGIPAAEALGKRVEEVFAEWKEETGSVELAAAPGLPVPRHSLPLTVEGRELWLSISGVRLAQGGVFAFYDVTAERELEQRQRDFIATVSHELRTPLAAVYGAVRTLERRQDLDDKDSARLVEMAVEQAERLRRLTEEILLASETDDTRLTMRPVSVEPVAVAQAAIEDARATLPADCSLELIAPEPVAPVVADADRLRQALDNLIENAIKFSPDGGPITVTVEAEDHAVAFVVSDQGLGIPLAEQERIFDRFYRLDPEQTRGIGGTGLGLYICRGLVERMGGKVSVRSAPDEGSAFRIELPR